MVDRSLVRELTSRLSQRMVEAIQADAATAAEGREGREGRRLAIREDRPRLELLMGRWMSEEVARINQARLQRGDGLLDALTDRELRSLAYAETIGAGPLERFMHDPLVEEIDVNSHLVTWVSYGDGRKVNVGQLWDSPDDLMAFQSRVKH